MSKKMVDAGTLKVNRYILLDNVPYKITSLDHSKSGKHGHAKIRIVATGVIDPTKKKSAVFPANTKVDVPIIEKKTAMVSAVMGDTLSVMDMEDYNTFEINMPEDEELKAKIQEGIQIEYWIIMDRIKIERVKSKG
ncbi:MAG: translation initiation factor IF-5A [Candidatus Helarchaeota archaeon]|nr:translation initiation factor IF-5A [Candidatus Helarchaeota archaeon]